jgi:undecaprenyl-diphosphatase
VNFWEAIILGIVQGATEFLPISSSAHLVLVPDILNMPEPGLTMVGVVHAGTLLAVLFYFRRDLWQISHAFLAGLVQKRPFATTESRLGWYILIGSIPAGAAGLLLEDFFERMFGSPRAAAAFLLVTAILLVLGEKLHSGSKQMEHITWLDAILIGLGQMLALFPGISRSGSTITVGLLRGLSRDVSARFSFLLGIPAIFGASLLAALDIMADGSWAAGWPVYVGAFTAAAISGYAAILFLLRWLQQHQLYGFAVYCLVVGSGYLIVSALS